LDLKTQSGGSSDGKRNRRRNDHSLQPIRGEAINEKEQNEEWQRRHVPAPFGSRNEVHD
jgi:hypothetical protein